MSAENLIGRLAGVRRTGHGRWIARCPAHDDSHASLSVRALEDGRTLVHDFAGCSVDEILAAIGLDFSGLYPERSPGDHLPRERRPFNGEDILRCLAFEASLASLAADNLARGIELTDADRARLRLAATRLGEAEEFAHG